MRPLDEQEQAAFGSFEGRVWLNTAHQGPLPTVAAVAGRRAIAAKTAPARMKDERFFSLPRDLKLAIARLIGVRAEDLVLANSTSYGLDLLANGLPLKAADEVLLVEGDFPATITPWLPLERHGNHGAPDSSSYASAASGAARQRAAPTDPCVLFELGVLVLRGSD